MGLLAVKAHRVDANQPAIVRELEQLGVSVQLTSQVGTDFPDLVWGFRHVTGLMEIKTAKGKLSDGQVEFHKAWRGAPILVPRSPEEAVRMVLEATRWKR